ncbi:MAG: flavodoxin family protein [Bacillota bacterium]
MRVLIITSSPNKDGLTAACGEQARLGAIASGAEANVVSLNELNIEKCRACNNGWGTCLGAGTCQTEDDFQELHDSLKDVDGLILVTPVYWWDLSESAKAFMDRLRRCEAFKKSEQFVSGKPVICVAAAGGTGNGFVSCLTVMEKFVDHLKGVKFDLIGITRRSKEYKLKTIYEAAKAMAAGQNVSPRI